jgi:hypothetical protein
MAASKLTDPQRIVLATAGARESGLVLPLPKSLSNNRGTLGVIINSLLARELLAERPAATGEDVWREAEDFNRYTLVITAAGLEAIGIEVTEAERADSAKTEGPKASVEPSEHLGPGSSLPKPGTKLGILIAALSQTDGATINELTQATNWQAHSVRGAISGNLKKKLKLDVISDVVDVRGRVYRITAAEVAR